MKDVRGAVARRADFFAALVLLATLLGFAGSLWWPLDLLAHFRAQYLFLGFVFLALAMLRPKKTTAAPALVVLINGALFATLFTGDDARPSDTPPLSILSYNVNTQNRFHEEAKAEILRLDADVVFAMEVNKPWMATLESIDGYDVVLARPASDNFGIAALSRIPLTSTAAVQHMPSGIVSIRLTVPWHGREIVVTATHPVPPINGRFAALRDGQLADIAEWSAGEERPHVVIGDLNVTVWSSAFDVLTDRGRLTDTTDGWTTTWPNGIPVLAPFRIPIDHALISSELAAIDRTIGNHAGSDHRPLRVRVTFRENPAESGRRVAAPRP